MFSKYDVQLSLGYNCDRILSWEVFFGSMKWPDHLKVHLQTQSTRFVKTFSEVLFLSLEKGCANYFWNLTNSGKLQRTAQVNKTDLCSNWLLEIQHSDWPRKHRWRLHNMIKRRRPSKDFWNYLCAEENWLPKVKNGVQNFISRYYIREWLNKTNFSKIN